MSNNAPSATAALPRDPAAGRAPPAISVLMPAWNAGPFIDAAIESVLAQTCPDFELIIVEDASGDDTGQRVEAWAGRDARIRLRRNERNLGFAPSLARAFELARAPWVARMDADDLSRPRRLELQLRAAERVAGTVLVTCPQDILRADGRIVGGRRAVCFQPELLPWFSLFYGRIGGGGQVLMSTEALRRSGGIRAEVTFAADSDVWQRMMRLAPPVVLDEPLYLWRSHNVHSDSRKVGFRYPRPSVELRRAELQHYCGLELTMEQAVLLADFWHRFPDPANDWDEAQRLLAAAIAGYRPPYPIQDFRRQAQIAVAAGWVRNAVRATRQRNAVTARAHLRRARAAAGPYWLRAWARFGQEALQARGQMERLH